MRVSLITCLLFAIIAGGHPACADDVAGFYANHPIRIIVPYDPGGYYDIGARLAARFLGDFIPGNPKVLVENQPSAGGIGLAKRFAAGQQNDGSVIGVLQRSIPQYAYVGYQSATFDPRQLVWIGSLSSYTTDSYVMFMDASHAAGSVAALQVGGKAPARLGAGRAGSANLIYALLARDALKLNVDIIRGYGGSAAIFLAEQSHEVDGFFADYSDVKHVMAEPLRTRRIVPILQVGRATRLPELAEAPTLRELVSDPAMQSLLAFSEMPFSIALPFAAPNGIPPERVSALQDAFMAMARDPRFLAEAEAVHAVVSPISGVEVARWVADGGNASDDVKAQFKVLISN